jgi:hypothetical protein|tara:strand:+ start:323 stop:622 length:300 start_codon:yes stop_codon:yes gene_type:complete
MFIQGNLNYTYSGRKKKTYKVKKVKKTFIPLNPQKHQQFRSIWWEQKKNQPKSREFLPWTDPKCQLYKKEISSKYTVSVPYNKGAYQVISKEDVKYIGK